MAKRRMTLHVRLPRYRHPRNSWRRDLHAEISKEQAACGVRYLEKDRLEVQVTLYLAKVQLAFHDVDNRAKDILDALQARCGGPKNERTLVPVISNDSQIYRLVIEKAEPPPQSHGLGHLIVRKHRPRARRS